MTLEPVDTECQPVFEGRVVVVSAYQVVVLRVEVSLVGQGGVGFIVNVFNAEAFYPYKLTRYHLAGEMHAGRVCLHYCCVTIDIYNKAGQEVALAMYKTIGIGIGAR